MPDATPTRQRLLDAALHLFATHGFDGTSVGAIEEAVGLQPRRGALYKHFGSKDDLLAEAVQAQLDDARLAAVQIEGLELSGATDLTEADLRALVLSLGRWFLGAMDRLEDLTRIFEQDGDRLAGLRDEAREALVDLSYRTATKVLAPFRPPDADLEVEAVLALAPLVVVRRTRWTYDAPPLGIDDDRLLAAWSAQLAGTLRSGGDRSFGAARRRGSHPGAPDR